MTTCLVSRQVSLFPAEGDLQLLWMLKLGTTGSEASLSSICSPPMAIRTQYFLSAFRSERGGGTFLLLSEVMGFSSFPQRSPHPQLHPAQPLDIPLSQAQALTSMETLLISNLPSLIVNSQHISFCRSLDTQHLDHYTPPTGEEPITHSPMRDLNTESSCPSPV